MSPSGRRWLYPLGWVALSYAIGIIGGTVLEYYLTEPVTYALYQLGLLGRWQRPAIPGTFNVEPWLIPVAILADLLPPTVRLTALHCTCCAMVAGIACPRKWWLW